MDEQARDDRRGRRCNICRIYAKILTNFYPLVCIGVILTSVACAVVSFVVYDIPAFDEPTKGFEARGTPITTSLISYVNYKYEDNTDVFENIFQSFPSSDQIGERKRRDAHETVSPPSPLGETTVSMTTYTEEPPGLDAEDPNTRICLNQRPDAEKGRLVFGVAGINDLLTDQAMKSMCKLEEEMIRSHPHFNRSCISCYNIGCPDSWSLGGYVALLNKKRSCADINGTDVDNARRLLHMCAPFYLNQSLTQYCSVDGRCVENLNDMSECITLDAVYHVLHFLTPDDFATDIVKSKDARLRLAMTFVPIDRYDYNLENIYLDNIHGKTFSDDFTTLKAIKFSIKFALFEQFLFSDIIYVGIGMIVILLLLWIYTQSFLVMIAALLNFILSLILAYFLYVVVFQRPFFPFVNITALILLIGIGADDTFVYMDLWRKALSERREQKLVIAVEDALRHATATMFVTSATTTAALFASMISTITAVKCFSLFTGLTILMNFVLTLTWLPSVIILQHRLMEICCKKKADGNTKSKFTKTLEWLLTPFRVFFDKILPFIVVKFRYVWLISLTLLGIASAVVVLYKPGLKLPTSSEFQILRKENYLEQYDLIYKKDFAFESDNLPRMPGSIVFGIQAKYSGDPWDPDDYGKLFLDDSFNISSPEQQLWLQAFCEELRNQSFYHSERFYQCPIDPFMSFMKRDCLNETLSPCCKESNFPYTATVFDTCLKECLITGYCYGISVEFSASDGKLAAMDFDFLSTTFSSFDFAIMNQYWKEVNKWMEGKFKTAPGSLANGWFTSMSGDQLWFFDLQQSLAIGTPISLGATLAIATVILIFTILNIILAFYAIISVAFVVFVTMGSLVLLGWELNIFESVIFTLAVGLSVDFTIHYGVAYSLAPSNHRTDRTEFSIQTMGSAITIAALSTFIAGAIMLPSTVNAYLQLGVFLMLVMSISWVYSTFYFQALCNVCGPQGKTGQLTACCKSDEPPSITEKDGSPVQNGGPSRESSKRVHAISGNATYVNVADINMGSVSPNKPDVVPSVALLPGTPHKVDEDSDIDNSRERQGRENPAFSP